MRKIHTKTIKGLAFSASAIALTVGSQAFAQDADCPEGQEEVGGECVAETVDVSDAGSQAVPGAIVVTGSRIQRNDTYNSISPLQVLDTETLQDAGQFDAASILQQSEFAAGQQIDATFQGFVLNNGPGSQTLNLRGLGADRTLLLINGRRMAPSGVEGAPSNPSINLLPASLIARYDLLLDGASSVYGSDAVAGVGNIVLRKDIDGLELFAQGNMNDYGDDFDYSVSAAWGKVGSNFSFGIGAEYARQDEVRIRDREFLEGCDSPYYISEDGRILTLNVAEVAYIEEDSGGTVSLPASSCKQQRITGRIQIAGTRLGFIYGDENDYGFGFGGNTGIPGFSESTNAFGEPVDADGDGIRDVDFQNYNPNADRLDTSFIRPEDRYNVMAYGEYTFDGDLNLTPFFEALYSRVDSTATSLQGQLFPWVPSSNPFNPCNLNQPDGLDCRAADNDFQGLTGTRFALGTGTSQAVRPIVGIVGDRNFVESTLEQYRGVVGLRGDLPFIDFGVGNDWTFEISGIYSRSEGSSSRTGVREDLLALALGIDPTADFNGDGIVDNDGDGIADDYISQTVSPLLAGGACDTSSLANPNLAAPDLLSAPCVPVNLFAPQLYNAAISDLSSQAERDAIFGTRTFDTVYEQTVVSAYLQGSLFNLPGGVAKAVIGGEYRNDTLDSQPDFVASNGLFWGFFADQGAQGSKDIFEAFGELDLPLMAGETLVEDLRLNLSGRITDDEFYGTNETYSIKFGWRPIEQLLVKFSYGTSFRAPNLRENFLAGQSGFGTITDPCAVPDDAFDEFNGGYQANDDRRPDFLIQNCLREGRDPTRVGINGPNGTNTSPFSSAEITSGGSLELDPETSTSITAGFAFEESLGPVDFSFNFNYYNINVKGAITEPTGQFIVNQCFLRREEGRSTLCNFINYDEDPAGRLLVSDVFAGFVNINEEIVEGIDLNATFGADVRAFGEDVRLGLNVRANHLMTRDTIFADDEGNLQIDNDAGEFGFPSWTGRATFSAEIDRLTLTWQARYIGDTAVSEAAGSQFDDAFGNRGTGFFPSGCTGDGSPTGTPAGDGIFCRAVDFADAYFTHNLSARYDFDSFTVRAGVSNVFDTAPPLVDSDFVFAISNTPIGNGYDLNGREFFASVNFKF